MNATDYLRKSECGAAMARFCRKNGLPYAVTPPGSKGHPFLVVTHYGRRVRVPFSMTPSDNRRGPLDAVGELRRALNEAGIPFSEGRKEEPVEKSASSNVPVPLRFAGDGAPLPPSNIRRRRSGGLAPGQHGQNAPYIQARRDWVCKRIKAGATCKEIAERLTATGVTIKTATVAQLGYELRSEGRIAPTWTPNGGLSMHPDAPRYAAALPAPTSEASAPTSEASPAPAEMMSGRFADAVTGALRKARADGPDAADALASEWIEKIAKARGIVEVEHIQAENENRYLRILDLLTA